MEARAREIATKAHEGQVRWGGEPFITHPEAVARKFHNWPEEYRVVAWLHDVVEDGGWTLQQLMNEGFTFLVVKTVDALTHRPEESYDAYIMRVMENDLAKRVKIADIEHNLSTSTDKQAKNKRIIWILSKLVLEQSIKLDRALAGR